MDCCKKMSHFCVSDPELLCLDARKPDKEDRKPPCLEYFPITFNVNILIDFYAEFFQQSNLKLVL